MPFIIGDSNCRGSVRTSHNYYTARYFKFKYRCQNFFLQPWKLLRILQNNDAIKYISHYKKYGRNDYGRTGLWTNRYMDELVYGRIVSKAGYAIIPHQPLFHILPFFAVYPLQWEWSPCLELLQQKCTKRTLEYQYNSFPV